MISVTERLLITCALFTIAFTNCDPIFLNRNAREATSEIDVDAAQIETTNTQSIDLDSTTIVFQQVTDTSITKQVPLESATVSVEVVQETTVKIPIITNTISLAIDETSVKVGTTNSVSTENLNEGVEVVQSTQVATSISQAAELTSTLAATKEIVIETTTSEKIETTQIAVAVEDTTKMIITTPQVQTKEIHAQTPSIVVSSSASAVAADVDEQDNEEVDDEETNDINENNALSNEDTQKPKEQESQISDDELTNDENLNEELEIDDETQVEDDAQNEEDDSKDDDKSEAVKVTQVNNMLKQAVASNEITSEQTSQQQQQQQQNNNNNNALNIKNKQKPSIDRNLIIVPCIFAFIIVGAVGIFVYKRVKKSRASGSQRKSNETNKPIYKEVNQKEDQDKQAIQEQEQEVKLL